MSIAGEYRFHRPLPTALRIILAAAGLFAIGAPAWEFRHAFLHPNLASLFSGAITLGAWAVGGAFVAGALFGEDQRWRVGQGEIGIERRNAFRRWSTRILATDIRGVTIEKTEWDSGPDTFGVVLTLHDGSRFETPGVEKRANAEEIERSLRGALGLPL